MRYLKMFESVQDERLAEDTWGIDPFELFSERKLIYRI